MASELDLLARGVSVGAFSVTALSVWFSDLRRDARLATVLMCVSAAAWALSESGQVNAAIGNPLALALLAFPVAGLFWLFVATVFDDRAVTAWRLAPAGLFLLIGLGIAWAPDGWQGGLILAFNLAAALICLDALARVVRGWRGDLVDARRTLRAGVLAVAAGFAAAQGGAAVLGRLDPGRGWTHLGVQASWGAAALGLIAVILGALFLQGRDPLFAGPAVTRQDSGARRRAVSRGLHAKLDAFMAAGGWAAEGLSIGGLARELGVAEHQLRRFINVELGHRNFASFVNGYRINAAKRRLGDSGEAATTVAAIAFELGYGSLSPFNRAFRAATGETPSQWRERTLSAAEAEIPRNR